MTPEHLLCPDSMISNRIMIVKIFFNMLREYQIRKILFYFLTFRLQFFRNKGIRAHKNEEEMLRVNNLKLPLNADIKQIKKQVAQECCLKETDLQNFKISKRSIDARNKNNVHFVYSVDFSSKVIPQNHKNIEEILPAEPLNFKIKKSAVRPIVVGSGPAGMFAALALAEAGLCPIILERGADVDTRRQEIETFWKIGKLNPETNVQFGEGGAGTFSDGKLMSGIKKDKFTAKVFNEFVAAGAPQEILYFAKPHVGTDNLRKVVKNIRKKIISLGGEYRFNHKLEDLIIENELLKSVLIKHGNETYELPTKWLFLALGHSARDTFEMLERRGLHLEQKPFSVGIRIEHKQALINEAQYGKAANNPYLGAADYKLAVHLPNGRSVYTFCMCPGGQVVAAASEIGRVVTNGMSEFARNKENANSALLVGVSGCDFGSDQPLAGMYFQRKLEELAFIAGGRNYQAPAQTVGDFLAARKSKKFADVMPSYLPQVTPSNLATILPTEICDSLRMAILQMNNKLCGFSCPSAIMTGVETRSSSPIRIVRDAAYQSNIKGIFPCGEGAGYAGGITSAAADGLKAVYSLNIE